MAWIESHQELRNHPKLAELSSLLGIQPVQAVGYLHFLWWWCMDYAMDGDLRRYNPRQVAMAAGYDAEPETFINAMVSSGFLNKTKHGFAVHDWLEFCGEIIRKRMMRKDERRKTAENGRNWQPKNAEMPPTVPNRTVPNQTNKNSPRKQFSKPTAQEATDYARSIGFKLDGEDFCAYYEARGWKYGPGRPMVDWKAAVVTWKKKASPAALISLPRAKAVDPKPEDCVGADDLKNLLGSLKVKGVPHA